MLSRATARRIPRDILRNHLRPPLATCTEYLPLPWLYTSTRQSRPSSSSISTPPRLVKKHPDLVNDSPNRRFATNAAAVMPEPVYDEGMSLYGTESVCSSKDNATMKLNPDLIIIDPPDRPNLPETHSGITALVNKSDILSHFFVCIQAGLLARAQIVLQQLHGMIGQGDPELTTCYNAFLNGLLQRAEENPKHVQMFFMWYEERMKGKYEVAPNAETIALLLKASLLVASEDIGVVYLRNFMEAAASSTIHPSEIFAKPMFTPEEVKYIVKATGVQFEQLYEEQKAVILRNIPCRRPEILDVPEVVSTAVRGHGLAAVKQSLRTLTNPDYIPGYKTPTMKPIPPEKRQQLLEEDAIRSSLDRWRKDWEARQQRGVLSGTKSINAQMYEWHLAFVPLIKQELGRVQEAERAPEKQGNSDRCLYGPFMRLLSPEKISVITMLEILRVCNEGSIITDGVKSSRAVMNVGLMLEHEVLADEIIKQTKKAEALAEIYSTPAKFSMFVRTQRSRFERGTSFGYDILPEWPTVVKAKLGAVLISLLIHCAKIEVAPKNFPPKIQRVEQYKQMENVLSIQPAFLHNYQYVRGKKLGVIKLHPEIVKKLGTEPQRLSVISRHLPMIVEPRPWAGPRDGGYYFSVVRAVRTKDSREQEAYVSAAALRGDLNQIFLALDVLGCTSWAINEKVFNVILEVWNSGEAVADIPPRELHLEFPPEPDPSKGPIARTTWTKEMKMKIAEKRNHHSLRCVVNFKLEIARAFLREKMYFPHNIDFRGRAYPIPPHLNHIGNDLCRGLLMFDAGKELGTTGLRWLKIHLSNVYGYDKASFEEREQFTNDHMDDIRDSVEKPLTGKRWWLEAEDPWQCLAACYAVNEAISLDDPARYKCHLPVAQDGTCNGLQHYAALGGDAVGARQVNLEPSNKPQDVYSGVAEMVRDKLEIDAKAGDDMAIRLLPLISRKVVKQTVMTNVYGVTFMGAKAQIQNQLKDIPALEGRDDLGLHSTYLTKKVFQCVRTMFNGAHHIQDWLGKSAWRISRSISPTQMSKYAEEEYSLHPQMGTAQSPATKIKKGLSDAIKQKRLFYMTSVVWTTPLGLPVVQPYRQKANQLIPTYLQNVFITDPNIIDEVNSRKQMTAFPPNYIHSLDATHMLLSAIECSKRGLTFAAVHDSFWTHPSDVNTLNEILRDAFITLHSSDLITKLYEEFTQRYSRFKYLASFPETSKVGAQIKAFRLKQSIGRTQGVRASEELVMEMERDRLLRSTDLREQERGKNMVTAASIAESALPEDMEAGSAGTAEEEILRQIPGIKNIDEIVGEEMTETQDAPNAQPQVVKLGSEDEIASVDIEESTYDDTISSVDESKAMGMSIFMEAVEAATTGKVKRAKKSTKPKAPKGSKNSKGFLRPNMKVNVWMQLIFPPVPPKGDYDVSRLEFSKYFFS